MEESRYLWDFAAGLELLRYRCSCKSCLESGSQIKKVKSIACYFESRRCLNRVISNYNLHDQACKKQFKFLRIIAGKYDMIETDI